MVKAFSALILSLTLVACASKQTVEETPAPVAEATPQPQAKPQIKYVYVDRTLPTVSAMTMSMPDVAPAKEINIWADIGRILWPLIALLGAGAVMIAGLYAEHMIINRQLAARRLRQQS